MSTVNGSSGATVSKALMDSMNGSRSTGTKSADGDAESRFMTLLVAQMKNQDPLNPLDNAQVTSQLAQLSTVTGITRLNTTLETLLAGYNTSQSLEAASMIGHGVFIAGDTMKLVDSTAVLGVELAEPADSVLVSIKDANGKEVQQLELGSHAAGIFPIVWDGTTKNGDAAAEGTYKFSVTATRAGASVALTALGYAVVNSVSTSNAGVRLNLTNNASVGLTDVRQIL